MPHVVQISAVELKRRIDAGEALTLLDVREDDERAFCSLPPSPKTRDLHVPMGQVAGAFEALREAAEAGPMVVYCHLGSRSMVVARWLVARGLVGLHNLEGGIDAWSADVDPSVPRY